MKKILSTLLTAVVTAGVVAVPAFAAVPGNTTITTTALSDIDPATDVVDENGNPYSNVQFQNGQLTMDYVVPNSTIYIKVPETAQAYGNNNIVRSDLAKANLFTFKGTKSTNSKLISAITWETEKSLNSTRANWIKITVNDNTATSEQKFTGQVTFKARKSSNDTASNNGYHTDTKVLLGDTLKLDLSIWIKNPSVGNDENVGTGDRVVFDPEANETNSLIWGDDRAALKFEADEQASKFYARLSTKANMDIYTKYGDPQNADLWFYEFVGSPTVPSTSRATLTIGMPWDEGDDYSPNPTDCHIYQLSSNGILTDVTSQFTYSAEDTDIEGWSIKTRTLGTYVLSDKELDLDAQETSSSSSTNSTSSASSDGSSSSAGTSSGEKDIPQTGASDMVNVAVAGAVLSLAAFAVIATKKMQK